MSKPYYADDGVTLHHGDALNVLGSMPDQSVDCIVTSPPYLGLRDYGVTGTTGMVAARHGLRYVGIDASRDFLDLSLRTRLRQGALIEGDTP